MEQSLVLTRPAASRAAFLRDGFVLLPAALPEDLLRRLRDDCEPIVAARDRGETSSETRHQTLFEPRYARRSFVDFFNLESLTGPAMEILGPEIPQFMGLAALLGARGHQWNKWHRDFSETEAEVRLMLEDPLCFIQLNAPLYDDASLWLVPGSHRRPALAAEAAFESLFAGCDFVGPYSRAAALDLDPRAHMPGAVNVRLRAGDVLFYNSLAWHSAEYRPEWKRITLHGGWRRRGAAETYKSLRWGLEHHPWLMEPGYLGDLGPAFGPQLKAYQEVFLRYIPLGPGTPHPPA